MLREFWNFHGDIAIQLESIARRKYGDVGRPFTKIYDADSIEGGHFVEVMLTLLRENSSMDNSRSDIDKFAEDSRKYIGVNGNAIPKEDAQSLFDRFNELYCE